MRFSPRSVEAFNRSGVLIQELEYPTLAMFSNPRDTSPKVAQIKLEVAIQGREGKFRALKKEYDAVCALEAEGKWQENQKGTSITAMQGLQPKSAMIEQEKMALERIKMKQQMEIEKMLGQEFTRKAIEKRNAEN